uniref:Uncharacterized protein n=1 Tax=Periophthalmus magnuspinnatus TaxID=409849 RepID=A0A3B4AIV9_9GOBI
LDPNLPGDITQTPPLPVPPPGKLDQSITSRSSLGALELVLMLLLAGDIEINPGPTSELTRLHSQLPWFLPQMFGLQLQLTSSPPPGLQLTGPPPPGLQLSGPSPPGLQLTGPPPPGLRLIGPPPPGLQLTGPPSPGLQLTGPPPPGLQLTGTPPPGLQLTGPPPPGLQLQLMYDLFKDFSEYIQQITKKGVVSKSNMRDYQFSVYTP